MQSSVPWKFHALIYSTAIDPLTPALFGVGVNCVWRQSSLATFKPTASAFASYGQSLSSALGTRCLHAVPNRRNGMERRMHSTRVLSTATAAGLISALLSIGLADAHPINAGAGIRGAPHGSWHAWRRNPWGSSRGVYPLGIYGYPYGDYLPYAGRDCVGSIQFKKAFCY
jgi:hypothetical protein